MEDGLGAMQIWVQILFWLCGLGQVQYLTELQVLGSSINVIPLLCGLNERADHVSVMSCSTAGWCGGPGVVYVWAESQGASASAPVPISRFTGRRNWLSCSPTEVGGAESVPSAPGVHMSLSVGYGNFP